MLITLKGQEVENRQLANAHKVLYNSGGDFNNAIMARNHKGLQLETKRLIRVIEKGKIKRTNT